MSISRVIESIERESFSRVMNPPEDGFDGQAEIKTYPDGTQWIVCPYCRKKQFKINPNTKVEKMPYVCKNNKCKREFIINV
ncbi:MAG TPA: hypothetical protein DDX68_06585 [Clostridium sp.]|nr:hypothetical protein [Clostridium sp.]